MKTDFLLVFTPNKPHSYRLNRFLVSKNTLHSYITPDNANKALFRAFTQNVDKTTLRFRKYGKIEIYLK